MVKKKAIIHCSDSMFGDVLEIDRWHKERKYAGIGYHFVILNGVIRARQKSAYNFNGMVQPGRSLNLKGAHCRGHNNTIGICLIGKIKFTSQQFISLVELLHDLKIKKQDIFPHNHFNSKKTCPNFDLDTWKLLYF